MPPFIPRKPKLRPTLAFDTTPALTSISPTKDRLAGGTAFTITGKNFRYETSGAAPIVRLGGVLATGVVVVSQNVITGVTGVALDPIVGDVTVQIGTQVGTLEGAFTYYEVTILAIEPAYGVIAGGTAVTLVGVNFDASLSYTVKFGTSNATGVTAFDSEHISCVTPNHAQGYVDVILLVGAVEYARLRNGFQFTLLTRGEDLRRNPGISIRDALNNTPNSCRFVVDGTSNIPLVGEKIEITDAFDADRLLFAGNVQSVEQVYEGLTDQLAWHASALDFTWLLNKYRPFGVYKNQSCSLVVTDLIRKFAPGFSAAFVQTKLARVSIELNGTEDFGTILNKLAQSIGGGHWYVDYLQRVHFFHNLPTNLIIPQTSGPITAMTVAEGAAIASVSSFPTGFYLFRSSNVFDNGVESAIGPYSNCVALQGTKQVVFTNIPLGVAVGTHAVAKRRLYYTLILPGAILPLERFVEINNNTSTGFTWTGFAYSDVDVSTLAADSVLPPVNRTVPPIAPAATMLADQGGAAIYQPQAPQLVTGRTATSYTAGRWAFKVSNVYRDGSESLPSVATPSALLDGASSAILTGIPIGATIDGIDVVARKIYASFGGHYQRSLASVIADLQASKNRGTLHDDWFRDIGHADSDYLQSNPIPQDYFGLAMTVGFGDLDGLLNVFTEPTWSPDTTMMWYLLNDNTTVSADVGPGTGAGLPISDGSNEDIPTWPNADGPSLEGGDPPSDINDLDPYLLREPAGTPFTLTSDQSQIRNRVYVIGAGSLLTQLALVGDTTIRVADLSRYSPNGGMVIAGSQRLTYTKLSAPLGTGTLTLKTGLLATLEDGTAVNLFYQADDLASQRERAKIELDSDGARTDGVHEHTIVDTQLTTQFQMYMRAYAELELFAWPIQTIVYSTRDPKTKSGQIVSVDLTDPPCVGDFLIQDVTIDQIHDDADGLSPRYTVSASSVKFDLDDLLLSLLGAGSENRLGGLATASVEFSRSNAPAIDTAMILGAGERSFSMSRIANNAIVSIGKAAAVTGVVSFVVEDRAYWEKITTGAIIGNQAGVRMSTDLAFDHLPLARVRFKTGSISACRIFTGVSAGGGFQNQDAQSSASLLSVGLMYSTPRGDSGWRPFTWDGVTFTLYAAVAPIAADTEYLMEVSVTDLTSAGGVATMILRTYNGSYTTIASTVPLSNQYTSAINTGNSSLCGPEVSIYTTEAVVKFVQWSNAYIEGGRPF